MDRRRCILLIVLGLLLTTAVVVSEDEDVDSKDEEESAELKEEDDVLVLNEGNFDDVVYSKDTILVEFYAPWCGHCKTLAPKYAKAAKALKAADPPVTLAKVDATQNSDLANRFDISGYPTLKFFKNGQAHEYEGDYQEQGIIQYMKEIADPNWQPPPPAVVKLTKDNFTEFINREELSLVEFYAPWCGHCKRLAPIYEKAAQELKKEDPSIPLAIIDATVNYEIAQEYGVTGYPTLKVFRKGRATDYKGEREQWDIVDYMIKQQGEAAKPIETVKSLQYAIQDTDVTIVGFFKEMTDPQLRVYMDAANELRDDFTFGFTLKEDCRNMYKINPGSVVVFTPKQFYSKFEPKWHILDKADFTVDDVKKFITDHQVPLVGEYMAASEKRYEKLLPLCMVFYTVDWSFEHRDATQMWRQKITAIAKDYRDITFAIANEEDHDTHLKDFGLDDSGEEMNIGILGKDHRKYRMEPMEEFDEDHIREFLDNFKKGKVAPQVKSQAVPKKQAGPVTIVVGKTFDKIVKDTSKDVLIEFYAPWCGHCKKLDPIYKDLAKKYKNDKNLVIAKLDATANDVPEPYKVEGFPTIYYAPANKKDKPVKFEGERDVEGFSKFLEKHATVSFGKLKEEL